MGADDLEDKLARQAVVEFLTEYLTKRYNEDIYEHLSDSFVLNIRAEWGAGKTFFLKQLEQHLKQNQFPVVRFDAWENDFSDDPLIGFIAEINSSLSEYYKDIPVVVQHIDETIAVARKLIKPIGLGIAQVLVKKLTSFSLDELKEVVSNSADEKGNGANKEAGDSPASVVEKCAEMAIKEHLNKRETIKVFKEKLGRLIEELKKRKGLAEGAFNLPLFVIVDELDRCRPTYAIELLEAIKHIFGVPGLYFVLATNLDQLGHSIKAVYGESFDSESYLKRFFDQEYLLPEPDNEKYADCLMGKYGINRFSDLYCALDATMIPSDRHVAIIFSKFAEAYDLTLRDQEQVAGVLQAMLLTWSGKRGVIHLIWLLALIVAKHKRAAEFLNFVRDPDNREIFERLMPSTMGKVKLTPSTGYFGNIAMHGGDNWPLGSVVLHYFNCASKSHRGLHEMANSLHGASSNADKEKVVYKLLEEFLGQIIQGDPKHSISTYTERVRGIGDLI